MKKEIKKENRDINRVELTGTIENLPEGCMYIPRPLISFDLKSYRRRKSEEDEWTADVNRIVLFDDEDFHKHFREGDRIFVTGELQSRNYTREHEDIDEIVRSAVANYIELWNEYPTVRPPKGQKRQLVHWDVLLEVGLIPSVPEDSIFKENRTKDREGSYVYRVDENGELYKESQHTTYEVVATKVEMVEEDFDELNGDHNKVVLLGRIAKDLRFDYVGSENPIAFCGFNVATESHFFEKRTFFNNVITWAKLAQSVFEKHKKDDVVKIIGRLQSRTYNKTIIKRWKTPAGKRKKKELNLELLTREISATKVFPIKK